VLVESRVLRWGKRFRPVPTSRPQPVLAEGTTAVTTADDVDRRAARSTARQAA